MLPLQEALPVFLTTDLPARGTGKRLESRFHSKVTDADHVKS